MADYSRETMQALREIAQEMRSLRRLLEGIDRRLATSGGLTKATTRRAHMIVDGDRQAVLCSACGGVHGDWTGSVEEVILDYGPQCEFCDAMLTGEAEFT